jgi:division protein CdvB (Snf7/Vps24/ESCRT-III family)
MNKYFCSHCVYDAKVKGNYEKHLKTKKHQKKLVEISQKLAEISPKLAENILNKKVKKIPQQNVQTYLSNPIKILQCKYCNKIFKHHSSLSKHVKYTCKNNKDEDLKELARLLNETIKDKDNQLNKMQKQIERLTNKLQIQNINNNITQFNLTNVNNIYLLNYSKTDYSHLTEGDYITCIKDCNHCVKTLIEKVHFNKDKPENMNIYISSIKGNYVMVYKDNSWQIQNKKEHIDDLYNYNEVVLENWYDDYKEKYPHIIQSFQRYLKNKDSNHNINSVKEEILLMLYNNRKLLNNAITNVE